MILENLSGGEFVSGAALVCALMIAPVHGFMCVSNSFSGTDLLYVMGPAVIPFAVTQIIRIVKEAVSK